MNVRRDGVTLADVNSIVAEADLSLVPPPLHEQAREALRQRDVAGFFVTTDNMRSVDLLWDNIGPLRALGVYEVALLGALTAPRVNLSHVPLSYLHMLMGIADRTRLLAAGDPLPGAGPFTLYRGVAGRGRARRVRGLSWTTSHARAAWFAQRGQMLGLPDPAVFEMTVEASTVYAYTNQREEQEFVVIPPRGTRLRRTRVSAAAPVETT